MSISNWLNFKDVPAFRNPHFWPRYEAMDLALVLLIGHGLEEIFPPELDRNKSVLKNKARIDALVEMPIENLIAAGVAPALPPAPDDHVAQRELHDLISTALSDLKPREQAVITRRFGLDGGPGCTLEEVAAEMQCSLESVRRIEAKALRLLRHPSHSRSLKAFLPDEKGGHALTPRPAPLSAAERKRELEKPAHEAWWREFFQRKRELEAVISSK